MTDSHRKAAEEWVRERAQIEDRANWITVDTAHLAGQKVGEQRAVEGVVDHLREAASCAYACDDAFNIQVARVLNEEADAIERGEWR